MNIKNTLGKNERLKSRKRIEKLFREGKSFSTFPIKVFYTIDHLPLTTSYLSLPVQAGFSASSKNFKRAVDRNRIKRLMRECYRVQKKNLYEVAVKNNVQLAVFFIYISKELPEYKILYEKMDVILQRLIKIVDEKISSDT
ncbi:MAG: ribonuclease P protein component [Bacteroidetes bacterium]|nr:ribonuclease P protein component [Bacteroidota bacterium]